MNWLLKVSQIPPKVIILSYAGGLITVFIGNRQYSYYCQPGTYNKIEKYVNNGWNGKAIAVLNKLERL